MAVRPTNPVPAVSSSANFTPHTGYSLQTTTSVQNTAYPVINPPTIVGVDFVTQTVPMGTSTITFPNLPVRSNTLPGAIPKNQPQILTIDQGDLILYEVSCQNAGVTVTPQVLDTTNLPYTNPSLGNGNYKTFSVIVTAASAGKITVWGHIYIQRGGGQ
jgi:hypothetical protein